MTTRLDKLIAGLKTDPVCTFKRAARFAANLVWAGFEKVLLFACRFLLALNDSTGMVAFDYHSLESGIRAWSVAGQRSISGSQFGFPEH